MKIKVMHRFFIVLIGLCGATAAFACSLPTDTSPYKNYTEHAKVFLGTVQQKSALGKDTYDVRVDEAFKGFPDKDKLGGDIPVAFNIRGQCGFDAPKQSSRVLVFMNDGDVVSSTSGSSFIWREAEQSEAHLNPVLDNLVLLRRMLGFRWPAVPDEETAVHLAMKAMIPVFGKEAVGKNKPYKARFHEDKPTDEERVWHVEGTRHCDEPSKRCRGRVLRATINKWTGDLIRISSSD
ncbi:MAG: NTF2 fold immunity protein [Burkholderiaceae bacterium]